MRGKWMLRHFLGGFLGLWVFWFGLGVVVRIELRERMTNAHAEAMLRRIPFWTHYAEEVGE